MFALTGNLYPYAQSGAFNLFDFVMSEGYSDSYGIGED